MRNMPRVAVAVVGAGALVSSVLTGAFASSPTTMRPHVRTHAAKNFSVKGNLTITGVLRVNKNASVYGKTYAHGGVQIWKGLLVRSGGTKTDSLNVVGPSAFAGQAAFQGNVAVAGTLQAAGPITGTSLALSGAATVGGALTVNDKVTAGGAGIATSGPLSAGSISTGTLTTTGNVNTGAGTITTAGLTTTGTMTARDLSLNGTLNLSGANVNFTGATVTGLNGGTGAGAGQFNALTIGTTGATSSPLTVAANGKSTTLGVNSAGALTVGDLATSGALTTAGNATVGGNLTVNGTGGVTAAVLQAPTPAGTTTQAPLTIQGNGINLNGNTTLQNGSDLNLSFPSGSTAATHVNASGDTDVAGNVTVIPGSSSGTTTVTAATEQTASVTFREPYANRPTVTVTAASDPAPGASTAPKVWVTLTQPTAGGTYTGFTIHYLNSGALTIPTSGAVAYNYHVIGS